MQHEVGVMPLLLQRMAFSPDSSLLVTLSHPGSGTHLALWSVGEQPAELVAGVELPAAVSGLAWATRTEQPTFYTVSHHGLVQWQLEPEDLTSSAVHMPPALRGLALSAVACGAGAGHGSSDSGSSAGSWQQLREMGTTASSADSAVIVGDGNGQVWRLLVDAGQDAHSPVLLADLQGLAVSCLQSDGQLCAVGTASGSLLLLAEGAHDSSLKRGAWRIVCSEQLDGAVTGLQVHAGSSQVAAATACGMLWQAGPSAPPSVLLCGQQHSMQGCHIALGAAWKNIPPTAALASASGISIWLLVSSSS